MASPKTGKWGITFDGYDVMAKRLNEINRFLGGAVAKEALKKSFEIVTPKIEDAWRPHDKTGKTARSLIRQPVIAEDNGVYTVQVGFDLKNGGMPSIWVMNGTRVFGTPRIKPDIKLRNAFYGAQTREEVTKAQEEIFYNAIRKAESKK